VARAGTGHRGPLRNSGRYGRRIIWNLGAQKKGGPGAAVEELSRIIAWGLILCSRLQKVSDGKKGMTATRGFNWKATAGKGQGKKQGGV